MDGTTHLSNVTAGLVTTAQAVPYGVSMGITHDAPVQYAATCLTDAQHAVRMELDFCITWLRGLSETAPASQPCCYTLTQTWNPHLAGPGCPPDRYRVNSGTDASRSITPR